MSSDILIWLGLAGLMLSLAARYLPDLKKLVKLPSITEARANKYTLQVVEAYIVIEAALTRAGADAVAEERRVKVLPAALKQHEEAQK